MGTSGDAQGYLAWRQGKDKADVFEKEVRVLQCAHDKQGRVSAPEDGIYEL